MPIYIACGVFDLGWSWLTIPSSPKKQKVRQPKLTHRKTQAPIVAKQIESSKAFTQNLSRGTALLPNNFGLSFVKKGIVPP